MASGKEIRTQISSVQNTQKITRAMEMVAASKMRKAQDRMHAARPYADKIRAVINHLAFAHSEYKHSYLEDRDVKRVGFIVISSDRGLCGPFNSNVFKKAVELIHSKYESQFNAGDVQILPIGKKSLEYFELSFSSIIGTSCPRSFPLFISSRSRSTNI